MDDYSSNLARNIENLRKSRGLSQLDLSKISGIPRTTLSNFESGSGNPSLNNLSLLARSLKVSIEELLSPQHSDVHIYKKEDLEKKGNSSVDVTKLLPEKIPGLEFEKMEFHPGAHMKGAPHLKGTREYFHCIKGRISIYVSGEKYIVKTGELISFKGDQAHAYINESKSPAIGVSLINLNI